MKKNGFTLAEVLITLAIIGVVATVTLPSLLTNTNEQQFVTAFKKSVNTLTEAAQMHSAMSGYDFSGIQTGALNFDDDAADGEEVMEMATILRARTSINYAASDNEYITNASNANVFTVDLGNTSHTTIIFRDGTALMYDRAATVATADNTVVLDDRLPVGFLGVIDTNGRKGPNVLSNCGDAGNPPTVLGASETRGAAADGAFANAVDAANCAQRTDRVIRDQFLVRFRGSVVEPEGDAASWALAN